MQTTAKEDKEIVESYEGQANTYPLWNNISLIQKEWNSPQCSQCLQAQEPQELKEAYQLPVTIYK